MSRPLLLVLSFALAGCLTEFDRSLLDGGARADAGRADAGLPGCRSVPLVEGVRVLAEPDRPPLPPRGELVRDPTFGTCVARLSDDALDGFATVDPVERGTINADATFAMPLTGTYRYHLYDLTAREHELELLVYARQQAHFSPADPGAFLHLDEGDPFTIVRVSTEGSELARFELGAAIAARFPDASALWLHARGASGDGSVLAITVDTAAGPARGVALVDLEAQAVISSRVLTDTVPEDTREVRLAVSPSGQFVAVVIGHEEVGPADSLDVYPRDLAGALFHLDADDDVGGWDVARGADGSDVLVYAQRQNLMRLALPPSQVPTVVLDQLRGNPLDPGSARSFVLVSGAAYDRPGWVVLSFAVCTVVGGEACATGAIWAQDKITLVSIDDTPRVIDLAWHRSTFGGSRHPHALPARDLSRVLFESTWGADHAELFMIEVPDVGAP